MNSDWIIPALAGAVFPVLDAASGNAGVSVAMKQHRLERWEANS